MRNVFLVLAANVALGATATYADDAHEPLAVEWADHAKDTKALFGDPIFERALFCPQPQDGPMACRLAVVTIGHNIPTSDSGCALIVQSHDYRTDEGRLKAFKRGNTIRLQLDDFAGTLTLNLEIKRTAPGLVIVEQASGVIVSKPIDGERTRATELVAFVQNTKGLEAAREWVEVDTKCSKVALIATKRTGK